MINNLKFFKIHSPCDEEYMKDLILIYIHKLEDYLQDLNTCFVLKNWNRLSNQAHKMKSPAALFGDVKLKELLEDLETVHPENLAFNTDLEIKIKAINKLLTKSITELHQVLDEF